MHCSVLITLMSHSFGVESLPVTICSSAGFLSFFLNIKSPSARDKARLPSIRRNYLMGGRKEGGVASATSLSQRQDMSCGPK